MQVPLSRWALDELYAPEVAAGRMYARCAGFVAGVDRFDAGCFGMPAAEALATDPQQRLLLEEAASAVASAPGGMASWAGSLAGKLAVGSTPEPKTASFRVTVRVSYDRCWQCTK